MKNEPWLLDHLPNMGGRLALDIGANVGDYSLWLCRLFSQVHAFEPNPLALQEFHRNCSDVQNIFVIECAVGAENGLLTLKTYKHHSHTSAYDDETLDTITRGSATGQFDVSMLSLDDAGYDTEPVDFIKIDTEGFECEVLKGAEETIAARHPQLLIEIHSESNGEWCTQFLDRHHYGFVRVAHPHENVPPGHYWLATIWPEE